ncbi:hypothetical protein M011DRAFT_75445 [Sporormia fimetaria CBS 119925]|uniref:Uncharacterized protein n=1 Tax=Sporormia fimetaria CBS 119925 TaxID=1340428 RepID=A0A6A6V7R4_9PLEO|nr:hypothetical protein M011DRAFT_75445 [Sporormia fimetaria CBS 119925]
MQAELRWRRSKARADKEPVGSNAITTNQMPTRRLSSNLTRWKLRKRAAFLGIGCETLVPARCNLGLSIRSAAGDLSTSIFDFTTYTQVTSSIRLSHFNAKGLYVELLIISIVAATYSPRYLGVGTTDLMLQYSAMTRWAHITTAVSGPVSFAHGSRRDISMSGYSQPLRRNTRFPNLHASATKGGTVRQSSARKPPSYPHTYTRVGHPR